MKVLASVPFTSAHAPLGADASPNSWEAAAYNTFTFVSLTTVPKEKGKSHDRRATPTGNPMGSFWSTRIRRAS